MKENLSIGVIIPTLNAERSLANCLLPLLNSPVNPRIFIIDSSSNDRTVRIAKSFNIEVAIIPRIEFNHGLTRERARRYLNTDIIILLTQDAYANEETLSSLIKPLLDQKASVAYARQIPHDGADIFEGFPREYNYPVSSHIRGIDDIKTYGVYTFFCSNSCAAYRNDALNSIGGFPPVLLGEDTLVVAKLLKAGHKIAYVAEATVKHSHKYTLLQEFQRYFDTGIARKEHQNLLKIGGKDTKRGLGYTSGLMKKLAKEKPWLLPYALMQTAVKFLGYQCGRACFRAPRWFIKIFSCQKCYWNKGRTNLH